MKVLHVLPSISPALGGPTEVALQLVRRLKESGVEAEIVTTNDDGATVLSVPCGERVLYHGVPVWFFPRSMVRWRQVIYSDELRRWLKSHINGYDFVDIHYLFTFSGSYAAHEAQRAVVPYSMRAMGQLTPWALARGRLRKDIWSWFCERANLNNARVIQCTSDIEVEEVKAYGIETPALNIPLGCENRSKVQNASERLRAQLKLPEHTEVVLFLSRLHPKKRPEDLIRAFSLLNREDPERARALVFAGSGEFEYIESLKTLAQSLGVAQQTYFVGFISGENKDLFLQGATLFILPTSSENFGLAILDAMSAGTAVITTRHTHLAMKLQKANAAYICEDDQIDTLTKAMQRLLGDAEARGALALRGQQFCNQEYTWERTAQLTQLLYEKYR